MKKLIFVGLVAILFITCAGQSKQENHWLIGSWEGEDDSLIVARITATFNVDGTGIYRGEENQFSINGNLLTMFYTEYKPFFQSEYIIYRINDQVLILQHPTQGMIHLRKINN